MKKRIFNMDFKKYHRLFLWIKLTEKSQFDLMLLNNVARALSSQQLHASEPVLVLQAFTALSNIFASERQEDSKVMLGCGIMLGSQALTISFLQFL